MKVMEHDAVIDLIWKTLEGDCTPAEQARVQALIAEDEVWESVYHGLVAVYNEGGHIALVDKQLGIAQEPISTETIDTVRPTQVHRPGNTGLSDRSHYTLMGVMGTIVMCLLLVSFQNLFSNRVHELEKPSKGLVAMANVPLAP